MSVATTVANGLSAPQWLLLLRGFARVAPMTDMRAWCAASGADWADVVDLWDRELLQVDGGRRKLPESMPGYGLPVGLTRRANVQVTRVILPIRDLLAKVAERPSGISVEQALSSALEETIVRAGEAGMVLALTVPDEHEVHLPSVVKATKARRTDINLVITAHGRTYL